MDTNVVLYFLAGRVAQALPQAEHQPVTREDIDRLLLDKLPEVLSEKQKLTKIHNLLSSLSGKKIQNIGSRGDSQWVLIKPDKQ